MTPSDLLDRYGGPKRRVQLVAAAIDVTPATVYAWLRLADSRRLVGISEETAIPKDAQRRILQIEAEKKERMK